MCISLHFECERSWSEEVESLYCDWKKWFDWNYIGKVIIKATTAHGHSSLECKQCNTVKQFVSGHDIFISLPTGGGKRAV